MGTFSDRLLLILLLGFPLFLGAAPLSEEHETSVRRHHPIYAAVEIVKGAFSKYEAEYDHWRNELRDPKKLEQLLIASRKMQPALRLALLHTLKGIPLTPNQFRDSLLDFSQFSPAEIDSEMMVEFLFAAYEEAKLRGILNKDILRRLGYLFAGDSFVPESAGFARIARRKYERVRDAATEEERRALDAGMRDRFSEQLSKALYRSPREAVTKLIEVKDIWGDKQYSEHADYLIGKPYIQQWDFAVKNLDLLFLLKAREISPEAKKISDNTVNYWLEDLENPERAVAIKAKQAAKIAEDRKFLRDALAQTGDPELLKQMEAASRLPSHGHKEGVIDSPSIIFGHQYRNLILKEVLSTYALTTKQKSLLNAQLEENEHELTGQLSQFEKGETTTDEITGFNTYTLVTTILTAKNPDRALTVIREKSAAPFAPYRIYSDYKATPRAGAARTVPYRLAELAHETDPEKQKLLKKKLADAATNFMNYLPDLMYHSRGNFMHSGDDQLAPYFFHPAVPFEAAALRLLANDPDFSVEQRKDFNDMRALLAKALLASQKKDGTFALPDRFADSDGDGGYSSSPIWVNPLAGLALLSLIDDTTDPSTQFGILDSTRFQNK